ncbi:efflux RND transporter permease subunit [Luteibacter anthropi]|uniref:Efflux RND transporter permease subunit n=1 Tax=Luteibacter anthropi TaxID=564369 RepID=A0A7X5UBN6_9GAMM|nr:efflux RND transporter permease subunit [Luteibacter anthropi]NII07498.1 efflux RND transporter permease subunit [Luteibacter anthropi]URX61236.1 efflux RND transporter permease subunit [Luteibacter anthropi]
MLALVRIALSRPLTFIVLALLILIAGPLAALRTPTDIFPNIGIPVISVVWTYTGLPPDQMSGRVIYYYERQLTTAVNDIEHIESQSLPGVGVVKIFFQPGVDIRTATAQVTSISQTVLKQMPPGITPPLILNYNASTVPVLQMALSSNKLSEANIRDIAQNFMRPTLVSVPGVAIPTPYGGKQKQVTLDLNPQALAAKGLSAQDVGTALSAQNQIIPVGTAKIGTFEYNVQLNNSPTAIDELNNLPIKTVNGATITIGDVAHVRDGSPPQNNVVRVDGKRAVLMPALKNGNASTLDVVAGIKKLLPLIQETQPKSLKTNLLGDQSIFVKASISSVAREGVIAALLTSVMILLFLGSWRSTVIIALSIPLAILSAIALLALFGQTLNVMTLGGLALAVGILVDDATVTIENINWHLEQGKGVIDAIMDGAKQIVTPAFVSLLCICIVFVPMFMLNGIAGFLFRPMALSVIFAMVSSFILSRTLVPTLAMYLLKPHHVETGVGAHPEDPYINHHEGDQHGRRKPAVLRALVAFQLGFEHRFTRIRDGYYAILGVALGNRKPFIIGFLCFVLASFVLVPALGRDFFPATDSDSISMHIRAPMGTRIEETAAEFDHIEAAIRRIVPPDQLDTIIDNIGLPLSGVNLVYNSSGTIGPQDGDIQIVLKEGHGASADFVRTMRAKLPREFPGTQFAFLPADMTSQILNFGAPAPLDVSISGRDRAGNEAYAQEIMKQMRKIPGIADVRLQQSSSYPQLNVTVNRVRADGLGITERDVTNSMVASLAGSSQVAPAFWLNPKNGVSYAIVAATPQYQMDSMADLKAMPVTSSGAHPTQILGGIATFKRGPSDAVVSHYNIMPSFDIYASIQDRDLGGVSSDVQKVLDHFAATRPKGTLVSLHGQVGTMNEAFSGLLFGLVGAVLLIYLLIVVNFQSWLDPFVIITALPAALAGIVWMLFLTHTSLSVPALTGAIMCMGVATANSILVVSFCRERLAEHGDAMKAALEAGFTRFRPVCMTALAMVIGMLPMALSHEQNSPLGRAVIGGLIFATFATLLFVPVIFSIVHGRTAPAPSDQRLIGDQPHVA